MFGDCGNSDRTTDRFRPCDRKLHEANGRFHQETCEIVCVNEPSHALNTREPQLLDSVPGADRGLRSGLTVPVRINDQFFGVFALFSSRPRAYTEADLVQAERLAAYLGG